MSAKYHETPEQEAIIGKVMKKFKNGELKDRAGKTVTNEKEAIAIALSEAKVPPRDDKNKK